MQLNSKNWNIILASQSPRRKQLLQELGYTFTQQSKNTDESFPESLPKKEIATYLSRKKAAAFEDEIKQGDLLIASDTVVLLKDQILEKPTDENDAFRMIQELSGKTHLVITGVCLKSVEKETAFSISTKVVFKELEDEEIWFYINNYKPFDKAGAYGIQEWIGQIGVERIGGSFYNVMGFPSKEVYEAIESF